MEEFKNLNLYGWRQFENVDIDLDRQLCVLTGPNGCGKTTILNVLGRHFGWNINFLSTPFISSRRERKFWTDVWRTIESDFLSPDKHVKVGEITYSSGINTELLAPSGSESSGQYNLTYSNQQSVVGLHIPSHRPISSYVNIENIPVNPKTNQQQFQEFQQLLFQTYGGGNARNPGVILKQSLIALALFGLGNEHVAPNYEYRNLFEGFQDVLKKLLPPELGFQKLEVRMPDIVLITTSGQFALDAMSGGVSAVFGMAWQIHMFGADKPSCTVIIDEPENHLHPSMQRRFLPSLARAFPRYRFIISTHSPFVVSSSPEAAVYALVFGHSKRIISQRLSDADLAGTPNRILEEVLDVPTTVPLWVEDRIRSVLAKYSNRQGDPAAMEQMFAELKEQGLERALSAFSSKK